MASSWIIARPTGNGGKRYRVLYRLGGRESKARYSGSFRTRSEALKRRRWVDGELAALRVPDLSALEQEPQRVPTVVEAVERWKGSRVDVSAGTATFHRVALDRLIPYIGDCRVDAITAEHLNETVVALSVKGRKPATIRKSIQTLAIVLDDAGIDPNPARGRIRYPYEERVEPEPPTSAHVEAVYRLLASAYRLPLLWLDWSGARLRSVESLRVGDYDEPGRRVRLRAATQKQRRALWVELPDVLADAIEATLPPREDRDPEAPLFPGASADRLRTAIARACKAAGIPTFSPHDLRHRRISLLHQQGRTWAQIGEFVGQRKLSVTSDTYTHVLSEGREADYMDLLG